MSDLPTNPNDGPRRVQPFSTFGDARTAERALLQDKGTVRDFRPQGRVVQRSTTRDTSPVEAGDPIDSDIARLEAHAAAVSVLEAENERLTAELAAAEDSLSVTQGKLDEALSTIATLNIELATARNESSAPTLDVPPAATAPKAPKTPPSPKAS